MPEENSVRSDLLHELNSYQDTVNFLLALIHELSWDDAVREVRTDVRHEHGGAQVAPGNKDAVTPDLAMSLGAQYGLVGDVKVGFAKTEERKKEIASQLIKYDRVVSGWKTPPRKGASARVANGCTVLLTHHTRKAEAAEYLKCEADAGRFTPANPFAIVGAVRAPQGNTEEFIELERSYGQLVPPEKDAKLGRVVSVRLDHLAIRYAVKFYDAQPPLVYLLQLIWDAILPALMPEESFRPRESGTRHPSVEVTTEQVAQKLRDMYSMRLLNSALPESPRKATVKRALDQLVAFKLGSRSEDGKLYRFIYRRLRRGSLEYFLQKMSQHKPAGRRRSRSRKQLSLFSSGSSGSSTEGGSQSEES